MTTQSQSFRRATSSPAKLVCKDGTAVPCMVKNLSAGGARLEVGPDAILPEEFHLAADDLKLNGAARIVWRTGSQLGLRFLVKLRLPNPRTAEGRPSSTHHSIDLGSITAPISRVEAFE